MNINNVQYSPLIGSYKTEQVGLSYSSSSNQTNVPSNEINIRRSDIAVSLKPILSDMSVVSGIRQDLLQQYEVTNNIAKTNSTQINNSYAITYNNIQDDIDKKVHSLIESKDYFDGLYGAPKLDIPAMVKQAKEKAKQVQEQLDKTQKYIAQLQQKAIKKIDQEVIKSKEQSPIKSYDFGKESSDFSANSLNNIAGSIVYAQGNINTTQIQKQVLY